MLRKIALSAVGMVVMAGLCRAEPMRPLLNKENRFPELHHAELGFRFGFSEVEDEDIPSASTNRYTYVPRIRYQVTEPLSLYVHVPFVDVDRETGSGDSGLGDVRVGAELLAFEDLFDYPWVIPFFEYVFDTGDEQKGTGQGESGGVLGLAVGSVVWEVCHFIADARYEIFSESDNIASIGFAIIWDVSDQFSAIGEFRGSNEDIPDDDDHPTLWLGGLSYEATDDWTFIGRAGAGNLLDVLVSLEVVYDL